MAGFAFNLAPGSELEERVRLTSGLSLQHGAHTGLKLLRDTGREDRVEYLDEKHRELMGKLVEDIAKVSDNAAETITCMCMCAVTLIASIVATGDYINFQIEVEQAEGLDEGASNDRT